MCLQWHAADNTDGFSEWNIGSAIMQKAAGTPCPYYLFQIKEF